MRRMYELLMAIIVLSAPPDAPRGEFDHVARGIERAVVESGTYDEDIVYELVSLGAREGHFDPRAVGHDSYGESYGLFQIHASNLAGLGVSKEMLFDPYVASLIAIDMLRMSHRVCAARPRADRLGWYASGGPTCDVPAGLRASRNRMALADRLRAACPPFWTGSWKL